MGADQAELHPGDVLFVPRGVFHSTSTVNGSAPSLHLTVGMETDRCAHPVLAAAPRAQAGWDRRCSDELTWGHWLADAIADVNAELPMWAGAPGPRLGARIPAV